MKKVLFLFLAVLLMTTGCMQCPQPSSTKAPNAYIDSISPATAAAGQAVKFQGHGTDPDGSVVAYKWRSSISGDLSTYASFETSTLAPGTHTITLAVQDNHGNWSPEATGTVTIAGATPPPPAASPPVVNSFVANPGSISSGSSSTLIWDVSGATSVTIDQGVGSVSNLGTRVVYPVTTTTYTLTATNASGSIPATTQVTVSSGSPIPIPGSDKPDLVITDVSRSGSTITYTIKNQGTATAGPSTSTLTVDGVAKAYDPVGPMSAGASSSESFAFSYSCSGTSDAVAVQADKDNVVDESNEGNNAYSETWSCLLQILPIQPLIPLLAKPDLTVTGIVVIGNKIYFTIKNNGAADAAASTAALYIDGVHKSNYSVPILADGATITAAFSYTYTCSGVSDSIMVKADQYGTVTESDEGNNEYTKPYTCP